MKLTIPILVEEIRHLGTSARSHHWMEPLLIGEPRGSDTSLSRGLASLKRSLELRLSELARAGEHAAVAAYGFFPEARIKSYAVRLDLRTGPVRIVVPVVMFPQWSRLLAFLPDARDVWFQVEPGGRHEDRVADVMTRVFRDFERRTEAQDTEDLLTRFAQQGRRLTIVPLDVWFRSGQALPRRSDTRAAVTPEHPFFGPLELGKVGRCLDDLYPDRLDRCFGRDDLVADLERLLAAPGNRPLAIVGPRLVGKTAAIHELIHRRSEAEARDERPSRESRENFWTVSPQRLIAGMSHLGQWEQRLLAILGFVEERRHVLVLDDVLGLYRAGQSAGSKLAVADVMRPWILGGRIRVIAELTPEQHRLLVERDRGLADALHVIRITEPTTDETLTILLHAVALLEKRHGARFAPDAVATALQVTRRHQREAAFPGKAIRILADLAVRQPAATHAMMIDPWAASVGGDGGWGRDREAEGATAWIDRQAVLLDFAQRSGLVTTFVDDDAHLSRADVVAGLRRLLVGQDTAVDILADVVSLAKAGLNDPERPLGSLLLVGPTGVGKTQAAKAIASVLFNDPQRLLRFDMNEFGSADAATRLVGSFARPDGLLTGAVRRQPFCVILFDEIEKAHPDVLDLLLQVLGEARLTDAVGLTTDFSNAVILLTSNLGSHEATRTLGFGGDTTVTAGVYRRAVQSFFRPEFVNRLDHMVVFDDLSREQVAAIARRILADVLAREGLVRRRCMLDVDSETVDWIVGRGYDQRLGARAMKRAVEQDFVLPIARTLAAASPELPTILIIRSHPKTHVVVRAVSIEQAVPPSQRVIASLSPDDCAIRAAAMLDRLAEQCRQHRPATPASFHAVPAEYAWHLGVMEQITELRQRHADVADRPTRQAGPHSLAAGLQGGVPGFHASWRGVSQFRNYVREMTAAIDVRDYFRELASAAPPARARDGEAYVRGTLARLDLMGPGANGYRVEEALLIMRGLIDDGVERQAVIERISTALMLPRVGFDPEWYWGESTARLNAKTGRAAPRRWWDLVPDAAAARRYRRTLKLDVALVSGQRGADFVKRLEGTYLVGTRDGRLTPFLVATLPLARDERPGDALATCLAAHETAIASGAPIESDPLRWRPVIEIIAADGFRPLSWEDFLPLPPEFAE